MNRRRTAQIRPTRGGTHVTRGDDGPRLERRVIRLSVQNGPDRGRRFELSSNHVTIGSSDGNDIQIVDDAVSGRHCEIRVVDDRMMLFDRQSTNGTFVNGVRVAEAEIPTGAQIRIGETELRFQPRRESDGLRASSDARFGELSGSSLPMREVFGLLSKVAPTDLSLLLHGETGTGKELAARSVHEASRRAGSPFVVVDCAAISITLSESELFGHEKGAFTDASRTHLGPFEAARGGTVFLDEVGELPLALQKNLLRVLESRQVRRVGGTEWIDVSFRVIAATHRDLSRMVEQGDFRQDLYYRMAGVEAHLPPLRDRGEDVIMLARAILHESPDSAFVLDEEASALLMAAAWDGNVRELRNALQRAIAFADSATSSVEVLRAAGVRPPDSSDSSELSDESAIAPESLAGLTLKQARQLAVKPLERTYLQQLLARHGTDLDRVASEAGVHRKSLLRMLREHDLRPSWLPNRPSDD